MPPKSEAQNLLEFLDMEDLRSLADHYNVPRARSTDAQIRNLIRHVGQDVGSFVASAGCFTLEFWKDLAEEHLGAARFRTWEETLEEIRRRLSRRGPDEEFEDVAGDANVTDVRDDRSLAQAVANYFSVAPRALLHRLEDYNGRTLVRNLYDELDEWARPETATTSPPRSRSDDDDDELQRLRQEVKQLRSERDQIRKILSRG